MNDEQTKEAYVEDKLTNLSLIDINPKSDCINSIINSKRDEILLENSLKLEENSVQEVRLAVLGNVDSGKSTLVGVLTKNIKDDGRGAARQLIFNYAHEKENGRTSSIAQEIIGFKNNIQVEPLRYTEKKNSSWKDILESSDKIIQVIDLCGHEKYLKTTMFGMTGLFPDYAMILVGTNMGVQRMTKEHLGIVISLNIPFFVVFTKIDIAPENVKTSTVESFTKLLTVAVQKKVVKVNSEKDAQSFADSMMGNKICPVFSVSSVTGEGIDNLRKFISHLTQRNNMNSDNTLIKTKNDKVEFLIDSCFTTKFGLVYAGVLSSGTVTLGQTLMLGPDVLGTYKQVQVKSIHFKRTDVKTVYAGQSCSFRLKALDKKVELRSDNFRKGMVLLDKDEQLKCYREFEAEVLVVHHSSTIKKGYQSVIHSGVVRQTATIIQIEPEILRGGDRGIVTFRFIKAPEYLHIGDIILFREGRTRGKGKITKITKLNTQ